MEVGLGSSLNHYQYADTSLSIGMENVCLALLLLTLAWDFGAITNPVGLE
jgi:hypothetical protein